MDKAALRAQIRAQMAALTPPRRAESDAALCARFLALPQVARAETLLLYYGVGAEIDTARLLSPLLAMGKTVALPKCLPGRRLVAKTVSNETVLLLHPFGVLEPGEDCPLLPKEDIDLILVPGLAFDKRGYRLGQGGGYYDRYLADYRGTTVSLCREEFLLPAVPTEPHDCPVELVLTEAGEERARKPAPSRR